MESYVIQLHSPFMSAKGNNVDRMRVSISMTRGGLHSALSTCLQSLGLLHRLVGRHSDLGAVKQGSQKTAGERG